MSGKPKFSPAQQEAIVRRYATGEESISAIAATLDTFRGTVAKVLLRHGVKVRPHQHALTPRERAVAIEKFSNGATARDLEALFHVDHTTINKIVRDGGGPLRRCGRKRHFNSREEWLAHPPVRMRKLLHTARAGAAKRGLAFEEALISVLETNPPKNCRCCGIVLDYAVYARTSAARDRSPSLDRCDNAQGYTVSNVYVVCFRCNRLKNDASLAELKLIVAYVERHVGK